MAGPFFLHWMDAGALPFDPAYAINDEEVLSFRIEHEEGDFATLEIEIINPRVGLLNEDRKLWAWLSYDKAWQPLPPQQAGDPPPTDSHTPDIRPLFYGRLVGMPEDLQNETISLHFLARPADYAEQQAAVADSLKVRPYWEPIWFAPENLDNPDNVLESRPELWHIDRITHVVSTSNIINGEDGTITLTEDDELYATMRMGYGAAPVRKIKITANVAWEQGGTGEIDLEPVVGKIIETLTGTALAENWPKTGAKLQGGWTVSEGHAERVDGNAPQVWGYQHFWEVDMQGGFFPVQIPDWQGEFNFSSGGAGSGAVYQIPAHLFKLPIGWVKPTLKLGWDVGRKRSEGIQFILEADVQSVLTDPGDEEVMELTFSSSELATALDPIDDSGNYAMPIGDLRSPRFFSTDRGEPAIEYLIAVGRAHLLARARTVNIDFEIPFNQGVDLGLSCRKSVVLQDYRLPGGTAGGKIKGYTLSCDGDSGALVCSISIGCSIGKGGTVTAVQGEPTYVEEGYMDDTQVYDNAYVMPFPGEINYASLNGASITDDGVSLYGMHATNIVRSYTVDYDYAFQASVLGARTHENSRGRSAYPDPNTLFKDLDAMATKVTLVIKPLTGGPFDTQYFIPTSLLAIPMTINLEAGVVS